MNEYKKIGSYFVNSEKILISNGQQDKANTIIDNVCNGLWCTIILQNHKFFTTTNLELISVHSLYEGIIYSNLLLNNRASWELIDESEKSDFYFHFDFEKYNQTELENLGLEKICKLPHCAKTINKIGCVTIAGDPSEKKNYKSKFSTFVLIDQNISEQKIIAVKTTFT